MKRIQKAILAGFVLGGVLAAAPEARAEVEIAEASGWTFFFDGRVNAFGSLGFGDGYPEAPADGSHQIARGSGFTTNQVTDDNKYFGVRFRSGFLGNIFGFGADRDLGGGTNLRVFMAIWATLETQSRWKYVPVYADVREGYLKLDGPWGNFLAGRSLGLFGRGSTEIDFRYMHGYGLGRPCEDKGLDEAGPTCGQIGHGVMFPGFSPGVVYQTPRAAGLALAVGLYDPAIFGGVATRTPYPRPEAELSFNVPIGADGEFHLFASGVWQRLGVEGTSSDDDVDAYGVSYGARLEVGPLRVAGSGFYGPGLGFGIALDGSPAAVRTDPATQLPELHVFDGYHGLIGGKFGKVEVAAGAGISRLHLLEDEKTDTTNSVPKTQFGISAGAFYHFTDNLTGGLDYFRAQYDWYLGEKQVLNFINAGVTVTW